MKEINIWEDGICNSCGSVVMEIASEYDVYIPESKYSDYINFCSNEECEHHICHYVSDQDELDYYNHGMVKS